MNGGSRRARVRVDDAEGLGRMREADPGWVVGDS
jgi:hypothetical protein